MVEISKKDGKEVDGCDGSGMWEGSIGWGCEVSLVGQGRRVMLVW